MDYLTFSGSKGIYMHPNILCMQLIKADRLCVVV